MCLRRRSPPNAEPRSPNDGQWISQRAAAGVALCGLVGTVLVVLLLDERLVIVIGAVVMSMVYGVYFGFAVKSGSSRDLATEVVFIVIGLTAAVLSVQSGGIYLAVGLLLHGVWDLLHHPKWRVVGTPGVPLWYIPFCAIYDIGAAVVIGVAVSSSNGTA
jgi:hypothetical protein